MDLDILATPITIAIAIAMYSTPTPIWGSILIAHIKNNPPIIEKTSPHIKTITIVATALLSSMNFLLLNIVKTHLKEIDKRFINLCWDEWSWWDYSVQSVKYVLLSPPHALLFITNLPIADGLKVVVLNKVTPCS